MLPLACKRPPLRTKHQQLTEHLPLRPRGHVIELRVPQRRSPLSHARAVIPAAAVCSLRRRGACCNAALSALARGGSRATCARRLGLATTRCLSRCARARPDAARCRSQCGVERVARASYGGASARAYGWQVVPLPACCGADAQCALPGAARRPADRARSLRRRGCQVAARDDPVGAHPARCVRLRCVRQP